MAARISFNIPDYTLCIVDANEQTIQDAGANIAEYAKESAPVDTGYYRNQIEFDGKNKVIAKAKYSAALEYGTKPHIITPNATKALHFKINGKEIFTRKVKHPGTKPLAVMRKAALRVQKEIGGIFIEHFKHV